MKDPPQKYQVRNSHIYVKNKITAFDIARDTEIKDGHQYLFIQPLILLDILDLGVLQPWIFMKNFNFEQL